MISRKVGELSPERQRQMEDIILELNKIETALLSVSATNEFAKDWLESVRSIRELVKGNKEGRLDFVQILIERIRRLIRNMKEPIQIPD